MFTTLKKLFGGANNAPSVEYWAGNIGLTLMMYDNHLGGHVQTNIRRYDYYFKTKPDFQRPASPPDFEKRLEAVINDIYYQHRLRLQQAEPDDVNYIAVVERVFRQLTPNEIAGKPWLTAQKPVWENSHCISLSADSFDKEDANAF